MYTYLVNKNPDWMKFFESIYFSGFRGNAATKYGKENEPKALKLYATQCEGEVLIDAGLLVRYQFPWVAYSADGIHRGKDGTLSLLEVKCPVKGRTAETFEEFVANIACLKKPRTLLQLKEKHPYFGQIQLGLLLYNLKLGKLLLYWKKKKTVIEVVVPFNEIFVQRFVSRLRIVYFEHLLPYLYENKEKCFIFKYGVDVS
jgi:hypothetical protein